MRKLVKSVIVSGLITIGLVAHASVSPCDQGLEVDYLIMMEDFSREVGQFRQLTDFLRTHRVTDETRTRTLGTIRSLIYLSYMRYKRFRANHPGDYTCTLTSVDPSESNVLDSSALDTWLSKMTETLRMIERETGGRPGQSADLSSSSVALR